MPRTKPLLLTLAVVIAMGCSGGQTGDPGVDEIISIDDEPGGAAPPAGGGGSCALSRTQNLGEPGKALIELGAAHVAHIDPLRGLSVVDRSDELELVARLRLPGNAIESVLAGSQLVVGVDRSTELHSFRDDRAEALAGAALLLVDLAEPRAPRLVAEVELGGQILDLHMVTRAGRTLVYVLSDGDDGPCPSAGNLVSLRSFEIVGDDLVERDTLALGRQVLAVAMREQRAVVIDDDTDAGRVRLVSLADEEGGLELGAGEASIALPPESLGPRASIALDLTEQTLRVAVSSDEGDTPHLASFDVSDLQAPAATSDCEVELRSPGGLIASFGSGRAFLNTWPAADGNLGPDALLQNQGMSVGLTADGSCLVEALPREGAARQYGLPDQSRLVEVESDGAGLIVRVRDGADGSVLAETTLPMPAEPAGLRYFPWDGAVLVPPDGAVEGLLGAYYEHPAVPGETGHGVQLFSFSSDAVTARGALAGSAPFAFGGSALSQIAGAVALWGTQVQRLDLADPDAPAIRDALEVAPYFARMWAFGSHLVRLRLPRGAQSASGVPPSVTEEALLEPPDAALATLEVIAADADPELTPVLASLRVNPWAQIVRVGDLLVSVANQERPGPRPTRIEVFDLADPLHPAKRGVIETDALWLHDDGGERIGPAVECLDCGAAGDWPWSLALPDALVLRAQSGQGGDREQVDHESLTFQVIDLGDPDKPVLRDPVAMPAQDHALNIFASGSRVYYSYSRPEPSDGALSRARFYYRELDFGVPATPIIGEPINVPGELVAVADDRVYTRELVETSDGFETLVHAVRGGANGAEVLATRSVGSHVVRAVDVDGMGHLLVDLGEQYTHTAEGFQTRWLPVVLRVLDATDLSALGELEVGIVAQRLAVAGERAFYASPGGIVVIDLREPTEPELDAYFPLWVGVPQHTRDLATGDLPLALASGALVPLAR